MPDVRTFLDTNVLIYAYDVSAGQKREIAREVVGRLWESGLGVLSTQVLQEFYVNVTGKIPTPLPKKTARDIVRDLLNWEVVGSDGAAVLSAIDLRLKYGYSFWDSMIIGSAISGGANLLLTEDLSDGQTVQGVKIVNPFGLA